MKDSTNREQGKPSSSPRTLSKIDRGSRSHVVGAIQSNFGNVATQRLVQESGGDVVQRALEQTLEIPPDIGKISISSFSMGGSASGQGPAAMQDLTFTKELDETSPLLFNAMMTNQSFDNVTLKLKKPPAAGGGEAEAEPFFTYTLMGVRVSSLSQGGAGAALETGSLRFTTIRMTSETGGTEAEHTTATVS